MDEPLKNPLSIGESKKSSKASPSKKGRSTSRALFRKKVSTVDKMFFARYLALMLRSGIPFTRGLEFLFVQIENPRFRDVIEKITRDVTGGITVADSMEKYPDVFDPLFVNMVRSGETAGNLEEVLEIVAEELEKAAELRSKVVGALIYPAIIVTMMIVVTVFIVFVVFPRIIKVYESLRVQVPLLTRLMIGAVLFITNNSKYIGLGIGAILVALFLWSRTRHGRRAFHRFVLMVPVMKNIVKKVNAVQFGRTLSALLKSGIATPEAIEVTARTFGNVHYKESVLSFATGVRQGRKLSDLIGAEARGIWPPVVAQMVSVGEETGALVDILRKLSQFFEAEVDNIIGNLTKIIEPVLMIVIGAMVGFIAIATVQLIYSSLQGVTGTGG